jgi:deoxyadenosine/deoxycytidine kinase
MIFLNEQRRAWFRCYLKRRIRQKGVDVENDETTENLMKLYLSLIHSN